MTFKELLKEKKTTQSELASRIGISQQSVSAWCAEKSYPHITTIFKIADVMHVSVDDVMRCFKEQER